MKAGAFDFMIKDNDRSYFKMIPVALESAVKRKEQECLFRKMVSAVEQSPSIIVITSKDGKIEYINPKVTELTGYSSEEIIGQKTSIFKSGFQDGNFYNSIWKTINSGMKWTGEFYNKTKSGNYYWEFSSIAPIVNESGETTHFLKVGEDISVKKRIEEQRLNNEKQKSILELTGIVSHEINQPLQIIMGYRELLAEKDKDDPSLQKTIKSIIGNTERIVDITNKIINLMKQQS
jgi:PAS domain S-box-containing protein